MKPAWRALAVLTLVTSLLSGCKPGDGTSVTDENSVPSVPTQADWSQHDQQSWLTDPAFAQDTAASLMKTATDSLAGTMELLSDAGIRISNDASNKTLLDARGPWKGGLQVNAGQTLALHAALGSSATFDLGDLLDLASQATGAPSEVPSALLATGVEEDLQDPDRNPVWAALVRYSGSEDLLPSLNAIAHGSSTNQQAPQLSSGQLFLLALRLRGEYAVTYQSLLANPKPPDAGSASPQPAAATKTTSPCKLDNPLLDAATGDLLKEGNRWVVQQNFMRGDTPIWKDTDLTSRQVGELLGARNFWSTIANMVLIKALTQIEINTEPDPLQRTKTDLRGDEALGSAYMHMSSGPSGEYQRCVELLFAAAGLTVKGQKARDLSNAVSTWSIDPSGPLVLSND